MSNETDYITYLETKVCDQDYRIKELEAVLMLILFNKENPVNKDFLYLMTSKALWKSYPFSHETINAYKKLLNEKAAKI